MARVCHNSKTRWSIKASLRAQKPAVIFAFRFRTLFLPRAFQVRRSVRLSSRQNAPAAAATSRWSSAPTAQLSDDELLVRLRNGENDALEFALARNWALVVDYVRRLTGSDDAAEDVAQRAFCQLWDRRAEWRAEGSLRALLCKIARNYAISEYRRDLADARAALEFNELRPALAPVDERLEGEQLRARIEHEIARLPARRREILVLRCVHDLSHKEIAHVMNIAPQTVANQLTAGIAALRTALGAALD
jgi:RNA polymerase sigma-70 factor (ECF subfamily)